MPGGGQDQLSRLWHASHLRQEALRDRLRFSQAATGGKEPGQRAAAVIHAKRAELDRARVEVRGASDLFGRQRIGEPGGRGAAGKGFVGGKRLERGHAGGQVLQPEAKIVGIALQETTRISRIGRQ